MANIEGPFDAEKLVKLLQNKLNLDPDKQFQVDWFSTDKVGRSIKSADYVIVSQVLGSGPHGTIVTPIAKIECFRFENYAVTPLCESQDFTKVLQILLLSYETKS
jgi:hypothetical protein